MRKILYGGARLAFIATFLMALVTPLFGFTTTADASVTRGGKFEAVVTVKSALGEKEFRDELNAYIDGFNSVSGDKDCVKVTGVKPAENGYEVSVSTRRADKIKVSGAFYYGKASEFAAEESENRRRLQYYANGDLHASLRVSRRDVVQNVTVGRPRDSYASDPILPRDENGNIADTDEFFTALAATDERVKLMNCFLIVEHVEKITVTFPGKILYYAGQDVEKTGERTLTLKPVEIYAQISRSDVTDAPQKERVNNVTAYAVYDTGTSPAAIAAIAIGATAVAGGLAAFVIYLIVIGKRAIREEEKKNVND